MSTTVSVAAAGEAQAQTSASQVSAANRMMHIRDAVQSVALGTMDRCVSSASNTDTCSALGESTAQLYRNALRPAAAQARDATDPDTGLIYVVDDNKVTIRGLDGSQAPSMAVTIPPTLESYPVVAIDDGAFYTSDITQVTIPASVTEIGKSAFYGSEALVDVVFAGESALSTINEQAFAMCTHLPKFNCPSSVTEIGKQAFWSCYALATVQLPDGSYSVGEEAFYLSGLQTLDIPGNVISVGGRAWNSCTRLTTITISGDVDTFPTDCFQGCSSLETLTITGTVRSNLSDVFYRSALKTLNISGTVQSIGATAFQQSDALESARITGTVESIGIRAFASCANLSSVTLPESLNSIGSEAFARCPKLSTINFPEGLTNIGNLAFQSCTSLTGIILPSSLENVDNDAFLECSKLAQVEVKSPTCTLSSSAFRDCDLKTVILAGPGTQWTLPPNELPAAAHVWCFEDGTVFGALDPLVLSGSPVTGTTVAQGETVTLSAKYNGDMPAGTRIRVDVATTGLTADSNEMMVTADNKTGSLTCTVTGSPGTEAECAVVKVGGQELTTVSPWTGTIILLPSVALSTTPSSGTVTAGETVTINLTGTNIGDDDVEGTLSLDGLAPTQRASTETFTLSKASADKSIPCVVQSGVSVVKVEVTELKAGSRDLERPAPISLTVTSAESSASPSQTESTEPSTSQSVAPASSTGPAGQTPQPPAASSGQSSNPPITSAGASSGSSSTVGGGTGSTTDSVVTVPAPPSSADISPVRPSASASTAPGASVSAAPSQSEAPGALSQYEPVALAPSATNMPADLAIVDIPDGTGTALTGIEIGSLWHESTADLLTSWIQDPSPGDTVRILERNGDPIGLDDQVATGMVVEVVAQDGTVLQQSTIVVMGDVVGSGEISLTQLVRTAKAYTGESPLYGVYAMAADFNRDAKITLTDLTKLAEIYLNGSLSVDCVIADAEDPADVLQSAGYTMEPWTDNLAVLTADIPEGANISSIAWTQHDFFPDGREQQLYYEGTDRALVFGTYTTGNTVITAVVTTASGKQGSRQTHITWGSDTTQEQLSDRSAAVIRTIETDDLPQMPSDEQKRIVEPRATANRPGAGATRPRPNASASTKPSAAASASASGTPTPKPSASVSASASVKPSASPSPSVSAAPSLSDLLRSFQSQVFKGTNTLRTDNRVKPRLKQSTKLSEVAMVRAKEMAAAGQLSHTRPDGSKYDTVAELDPSTVIGENIHCNKGYPTPEIAEVAQRGWENSAPHRAQMLLPQYAYIGTGFAEAADGTWFCVQIFSNGDKVISVDTPKSPV